MKVTAGIGVGAAYLAGGLVVAEAAGITMIGSAPLSTLPGTLSASATALGSTVVQGVTRAGAAVAARVTAGAGFLMTQYDRFSAFAMRTWYSLNEAWEALPGRARAAVDITCELELGASPSGTLQLGMMRSSGGGGGGGGGGRGTRTSGGAPGRRMRLVTADDIRCDDFSHSRLLSLTENGGNCEYCQRLPATHGDHFVPAHYYAGEVNAKNMTLREARVEANDVSNIVGACDLCNLGKSSKIPTLRQAQAAGSPRTRRNGSGGCSGTSPAASGAGSGQAANRRCGTTRRRSSAELRADRRPAATVP